MVFSREPYKRPWQLLKQLLKRTSTIKDADALSIKTNVKLQNTLK